MARTSPPRPSDHSPSCPAYSPSAKYSSCTCGLTTPRKSKRPTIEEATEKALAVDAVETEAERKGREQREAMEAAIMSPGTTNQKQVTAACPRCSECIGQKHHWIEAAVYEPGDPAYECKHCDAACGMRSDGAPNGKLIPKRVESDSALDDDPDLEAELDELAAKEPAVAAAAQALDEVTDRLARRDPPRIGSGYPGGGVDRSRPRDWRDDIEAGLRRVSITVSNLSSHRVNVVQGSGALLVEQVCLVCRESITSGAPSCEQEIETIAAVGLSARKARLKHRCADVETQVPAGTTRAELEALAQELEHDGTAMVKRSIEIAKLAAERKGATP
jgi:hypothetical protein